MPVPRKLLIRLIGAPLLLAALGGILVLSHRQEVKGGANPYLAALLWVVAWISAHEMVGFARAKDLPASRFPAGLCLAGFFGPRLFVHDFAAGPSPLETWALSIVVAFVCAAGLLVFRFEKVTPPGGVFSFFAAAYVSLLAFLLFPPVARAVSTFYLLFLLACSKGSDMAAFVVGKSIGKHKMAPVVSPNKTWEGGIGGGIAGTAAGFAVIWWTPLKTAFSAVPVPALLVFALLVTIAAQVGDLVKSAFKRWAGVKDSGRLLPEFGGMLDMVDSFLVAGPVAYLAALFLLEKWKG